MDKKGHLIKDHNLNILRNSLKIAGTATKPRLAELTGLSVVTVNSLVNTLLEAGEISPDRIVSSEGGRPAASYTYNSNYRLGLSIYMHEHRGKHCAFYCVLNLRGEIVEKCEQLLSNVSVESFDPKVGELLDKYPQIRAICFGVPGQEINHKLIISDYIGMSEQSLSGYYHNKYSIPVLVENDINAAVAGYCDQNNLSKDKCIIGIYFPDKYPPGAGIYMNGQIHKGKNGLAGEIKYLPLGIDWDSFQYTSEAMEDVMIKTVKALSCSFNPDEIVLYGEIFMPSILVRIKESFKSPAEKLLIPKLVISNELSSDFEAGIRQLSLKLIDTVVC